MSASPSSVSSTTLGWFTRSACGSAMRGNLAAAAPLRYRACRWRGQSVCAVAVARRALARTTPLRYAPPVTTSAREPEGIHNFRELAPYPLSSGQRIRPGAIYRSGALELMTADDCSWLTGEVGLATILDLRHPDEVQPANQHALSGLVRAISIFPEDQRQEDVIAELNGLYGA